MDTRISHNPQKWFAERRAEILADPDLSDAGRQRRIAEARKKAGDEARHQQEQKVKARQSALDSALLPLKRPPGGHSLESRQLLEQTRKELKDHAKAPDALRAARQSGDTLAEWAIGLIAIEKCLSGLPVGQGWADTLELYGESPGVDRYLSELDKVVGEQPSRTQIMLEGAFGSSEAEYPLTAADGDRDPRDDLSDAGRRRWDIREQHERVWEQQRSPQPYIGPSAHRDPVDDGAPIVPGVWG